ncbi:MAG: MarR family transcriptional regulator [Bacteroidales bacterium]|nr:MarR family transcriptional regulator [Bacteroidales bacterium]MBN2764292.1 MarR family transcriptional regulator [Bacteroidales bacterium]
MTSEERIKRQKELIEAMGTYFDKDGFQPVAGRILGLLIIMDKERFTFDEIVEELQISKSSASNAIRMLEIRNFIEYITKPGDRKRYFQIRKFDKFSLIDEHKTKLKTTCDYLQAVLELKANKEAENAVFIKNMIDMLIFFLDKFDELKKEYINRP